jgi:hypothetical protein
MGLTRLGLLAQEALAARRGLQEAPFAPRSVQQSPVVMRGMWTIAGFPRGMVVTQMVLAQINDFVTGSLTTVRIDGENENWTIEGNNVYPAVKLTLIAYGRAPLLFTGQFQGEILVGQLGPSPVKMFRPRKGLVRGLSGAWTMSGLGPRYTPTNFILDELNDALLGTLSVIDGGGNVDFTVYGNDFRPEINDVELLFLAPTTAQSFTFAGTVGEHDVVTGDLTGAFSGPAKLARTTWGPQLRPSTLDGSWMLTGLPSHWTVIVLVLGQIQERVSGSLDISVDGTQQSFDILGSHDHPSLKIRFRSSTELPSFDFEGTFVTLLGKRTITGVLSGGLSGPATLVPV